jgi:hypothetical protein
MRKNIVHFCLPRWFQAVVILLPLIGGGISCLAQPSGGPYGPVQQSYAVPAEAAHVYFVAPDGKADATGAQLDAPTTLESAIERVTTGDAIVMRGGMYRTGSLKLNQGITMQPYADERPVLKGTQVATNWQALRDIVWRTSWPALFPQKPAGWWQREREGMRTPQHRFNNDMVFVDGRRLISAGWEGELTTNNFYIDYEHGQVFLGFNPAGHLMEITVFDSALVDADTVRVSRDRGGRARAGRRGGRVHLREGRGGVRVRERDDFAVFARGGIFSRGPDGVPELPDQRHGHGGDLPDCVVGLSAGTEHFCTEQRAADHGVFSVGGEDFQPDAPGGVP